MSRRIVSKLSKVFKSPMIAEFYLDLVENGYVVELDILNSVEFAYLKDFPSIIQSDSYVKLKNDFSINNSKAFDYMELIEKMLMPYWRNSHFAKGDDSYFEDYMSQHNDFIKEEHRSFVKRRRNNPLNDEQIEAEYNGFMVSYVRKVLFQKLNDPDIYISSMVIDIMPSFLLSVLYRDLS